MIGKTNVGGSINAYAYIVVQHPSGATITCTYSKRIISLAADTSLVLVSDGASSCDVTATSGAQTAVKTVSITSGESYYISLAFETYIVKEGIEQNNVEFTLVGKRYNNSTTATSDVNTIDHKTGYIQVRARANSGRAAALYCSTTIKSLLGSYSYLNVKCQRYCTGGSNEFKLKLGTYYGTAANSSDNFLDAAQELVHTDDGSVVTLQIPLTSATTGAEDVYFALAFCCGTSSGFGADIYDIYLTNEELQS